MELLDFKTAVGFEPRILAVLVYVQPNPYITHHISGIVRFFKWLRDLIPESKQNWSMCIQIPTLHTISVELLYF